eukprot:CAMPEP_0195127902 /NCGR_PEP_ID=MMETSP0448-20130528/138054_1 /TAXON_ID=66468 /ORGANISM="Heterocapsa triquestra, Strain CCMP 448" /LENGTH=56 /DNA_ID=CAMNT_0040165679 /DNA_START=69 /DNA_END=236 /DNA_ORIENTATION=+
MSSSSWKDASETGNRIVVKHTFIDVVGSPGCSDGEPEPHGLQARHRTCSDSALYHA